MAVSIHKLFNLQYDRNKETKQAISFCQTLSDYMPQEADGDIYVLPNMTCPQARNKDLDLVIWFNTRNYWIETKTGYWAENGTDSRLPLRRKVRLDNALLVLELKSHNTYKSIKIENQNLALIYSDGWHNASEQSNGQKNALVNFMKDHTGNSPFVVNLIWMYNAQDVNHYDQHQVDNVLWGSCPPNKLFEVVFRNNLPFLIEGEHLVYNSCRKKYIQDATTEYFEVLRKNTAIGIGRVSRKKVNELIQKDINEMTRNYFNGIGNKLTIINGNPGTGKTIHLIHLANNLNTQRGMTSVILTFNKALEQDIKRLIYFSGLSDGKSIAVMTWDSFVFHCLSEMEEPADGEFEQWLSKLKDYVELSDNPREDFKTANSFDCVLIDEGQDWSDHKKEIIFKLFGSNHSVVSIGENQLVQGEQQNWKDGIGRDDRQEFRLDTSHRNKTNIVDFLNRYSKEQTYDWDLRKNDNITGGRIVITNSYSYEIHKELVQDLQENENSFYDMMFLSGTNEQLSKIQEQINSYGHKGFIANSPDNRNKIFPLDHFRILTYQSCRGLEGWIVVCYELDLFIEKSLKNKENPDYEAAVQNWLFIVLTRAIDTLVFTLHDMDSSTSQLTMRLANEMDGIIDIRNT